MSFSDSTAASPDPDAAPAVRTETVELGNGDIVTRPLRPQVLAVTAPGCVPTVVEVGYDFLTGGRRIGSLSIACESYGQRDAYMAQILAMDSSEGQIEMFDQLRQQA